LLENKAKRTLLQSINNKFVFTKFKSSNVPLTSSFIRLINAMWRYLARINSALILHKNKANISLYFKNSTIYGSESFANGFFFVVLFCGSRRLYSHIKFAPFELNSLIN